MNKSNITNIITVITMLFGYLNGNNLIYMVGLKLICQEKN